MLLILIKFLFDRNGRNTAEWRIICKMLAIYDMGDDSDFSFKKISFSHYSYIYDVVHFFDKIRYTAKGSLTYLLLVPHICVSESG